MSGSGKESIESKSQKLLLEFYMNDYEKRDKIGESLNQRANTLFAFSTSTTAILFGVQQISIAGVDISSDILVGVSFFISIVLFLIVDLTTLAVSFLRWTKSDMFPVDIDVVRNLFHLSLEELYEERIQIIVDALRGMDEIDDRRAIYLQISQVLVMVAIAFLTLTFILALGSVM